MRLLSMFLLLFALLAVSACTGEDRIVEKEVVKEQVQCYDGTVRATVAECPRPQPSGGTTQDDDDDDDIDRGGECNLIATGRAPFNGSSEADVICGDEDNNTIRAGDGEDTVYAKGGNDTVDGGKKNDKLYGEAGNDTLNGGPDEDVIDGGPGKDILIGNEGDDILRGGDGSSDTVRYMGTELEAVGGTAVPLMINLADGYSDDEYEDQDRYEGIENVEIVGVTGGEYEITGDGEANILTGKAGTYTVNGGGGDDTIEVAAASSEGVEGGLGHDTLIVSVTTTINSTGYSGFEGLQAKAGSGNIGLMGDEEDNTLVGNEGDNDLEGAGKKDTLTGGAGRDCFKLPTFEAITVDASDQDATRETVAVRVAEVEATRDIVIDYKTEDIINVAGAAEIRGRNIVVVVVAKAARVPADPDAGTEAVPAIPERAPVLAEIRGDIPTSIQADCTRN